MWLQPAWHFMMGEMFPKKYKNNIFITLHGSWNRSKKVGYKVIRVVLDGEGDVIDTKDFISGWLDGEKSFGTSSCSFDCF